MFSIFYLPSKVKKLENEIENLSVTISRLKRRLDQKELESIKFKVGDFVKAPHYPDDGRTQKIKGIISNIGINDYGYITATVRTGYGSITSNIDQLEPIECKDLLPQKKTKRG